MSKIMIPLLFIILLAFTCGAQQSQKQNEQQYLLQTEVPQSVVTSFEKEYPTAKVQKYWKEDDEEGKTLYVVESMDNTIDRSVYFDALGNLLTIKEVILFEDLPDAVSAAYKKGYAKAKPTKCQKVIKGDIIQYEIDASLGYQDFTLTFSSDGVQIAKKTI